MASESKDGQGSADHDTPFVWGNPLASMTAWQRVHLSLMRADIRAYKAGELGRAPDGDLSVHDTGEA